MANLIFKTARSVENFDSISTSHVNDYQGFVLIELPYYAGSRGVESVMLQLNKVEALELAARIVNTVAHQ